MNTHTYIKYILSKVISQSWDSYLKGLQELGNILNKTNKATQMVQLNQASKYSEHSVSPKCRLSEFICIFTNIYSHLTHKMGGKKRSVYSKVHL